MEPTGHYWLSLARWLSVKGIEAVLVNPHLVKKNKENRDNTPSKSDRKDALVIADMVKNGYYSPVRFNPEVYEELRILMANRDTVAKRLNSAVNQIHRWVDMCLSVWPKAAKLTIRLKCLRKQLKQHFLTSSCIRRMDKKHGVSGGIKQKGSTRSVRKSELYPLVRCDEGMKGLRPVETWE